MERLWIYHFIRNLAYETTILISSKRVGRIVNWYLKNCPVQAKQAWHEGMRMWLDKQ